MKKIVNLLLLFVIISLCACGEYSEAPVKPTTPTITETKPSDITKPTEPTVSTTPETEIEFKVSLIYNHKIFIPNEEIKVIWSNDYSQVGAIIDSNGYAITKGLDGEYNVYLDKVPDGYTYNPNIYVANNENPILEIELEKITKTRKGKGTSSNPYSVTSTGYYQATISKENAQVYFEYHPMEAGYYIIESYVNIYEDLVEPKVDKYNANAGGFKVLDKKIDDGGASKKGGYTTNFKYVMRLYEDQLGNVYVFAVHGESKIDVYPITIDFSITYAGEYYYEDPVAKLMVPEENLIATPEASEYLDLELDLISDNIKFKFATRDYMYLEFFVTNHNNEKIIDFVDYINVGNLTENQTTINETYSGIRHINLTGDVGGSTSYDAEELIVEYKMKFNSDNSGSYEIVTKYREYHNDGMAEETLAEEVWDEIEGNFTYELDARKKTYQYYNSNGGTGSYYSTPLNGSQVIDGNIFKYDEECGYWRVYDSQTDTFGPILCVAIAKPCAYYEESLNLIESHGNKNLTVQNLETNEFENHKQFIEVYYTGISNSDGVCYVTMEMKEFLQKFSVSQRLFFDGNGFVEMTGVYAKEEDQWLFACGYYLEK